MLIKEISMDRYIETIERMQVQHRGQWLPIRIVRVITSTAITIGFYIPNLAAEGIGFSNEKEAIVSALKIVAGAVLLAIALL